MAEEQKQPTAEAIPEPQQPTAIPEPQQAMQSQVTSQTPAKKPAKNPKRVAAGKAVAERTRLAREAMKKAYNEKMAQESEKKETAPAPAPAPEPAAADSEGFTTNQLIAMGGIAATLLTTYVKRDDIKAFFAKKTGISTGAAAKRTSSSAAATTAKKRNSQNGLIFHLNKFFDTDIAKWDLTLPKF